MGSQLYLEDKKVLLKIPDDWQVTASNWYNKKAPPVKEEPNYLFSGFNPNIAIISSATYLRPGY
ncbi:hypothetical protein [Terrimonas alba]|uniref:hypothetical protein n=1 Tax=Terrimonas alba TaxID=3349636 RepID=UPI0035F45B8F